MKKQNLQNRKPHRICLILGICLISGLFLLCGNPAKAGAAKKKVLFISSYSYGCKTTQEQIEGIEDTFPGNYLVDFEFMDTNRVNDTTAYRLFYDGIRHRMLRTDPYDLVLVGDDAALQFVLRYQGELFPDVPIVFMGINDASLARRAGEDRWITGVSQTLNYDKTIEMATNIYPSLDTVVAIFDESTTGQVERRNYTKLKNSYPNLKLNVINSCDYTQSQLIKQLSDMSYETILLYINMNMDGEETVYQQEESLDLILTYAKVPVFCLMQNDVGTGALGGCVFSAKENSIEAANIAIDVLEGRKEIFEIPVSVKEAEKFYADNNVVERFSINKKLFPKGTIFLNKEPSFFEKYEAAIKPTIIILLISSAIVAWFCYDNMKHKKLVAEMKEMKDNLENASQHDFLTGLPNRSKFMADLKEVTFNEIPCTVIMLDLDNFKGINDTLGHAMGDEALKGVAGRLKAMKTPLFTPYRFAGDEFIMILKSDNAKIVENSIQQCQHVFRKPYKLLNCTMDIHGSIGAATYPTDTTDMEQLIVCADDAMYHIKKEGKDGYAYYRDIKKKQ